MKSQLDMISLYHSKQNERKRGMVEEEKGGAK